MKCQHISLHRFVIGAKPGEIVDHINRDRLDNRRVNLRIVNPRQSSANRGPKGSPWRETKYKAVWKYGAKRGWKTMVDGINSPRFKDEEVAALAYDMAAKKLYGEYAYQNFPNRKDVSVTIRDLSRILGWLTRLGNSQKNFT